MEYYMSVQLAKDNLLFRLSLFTERRTICRTKRTMLLLSNEKKKRTQITIRLDQDYYPFNQTFLDDYYRRWEAENSKN